MPDCIFCKILSGAIPSTRVYEDASFVAILDIHPVSKGHTLVMPKQHEENLLAASADTQTRLLSVVQKIAAAQMKALGATGFNVIVNNGRASGQLVDHLHVHVIPRFPDDGLMHWPGKEYGPGEQERVGDVLRAAL